MRSLAAAAILCAATTPLLAQHDHPAPMRLGTVRFPTSCSAAAQPDFTMGVALLHSFAFSFADSAFARALRADPDCAMAWWGLSLDAWANPMAAGIKPAGQVQRGLAAVQRARTTGRPTERERGYIEAVAHLYERADSLPQRARLAAYRDAMDALARQQPADTEAVIFAALARAAAADPGDKSYADQLAAGAVLERLWAAQPDHPGLAHYIIHAYDVPPLAARAESAAARYAVIAPSVSHALHMPSHTYTRVGQWQQSIASNIAAGNAARSEGATAELLHAMDYRMYAYLQLGRYREAREVLDSAPVIAARLASTTVVTAAAPASGYFGAAAIEARWVLERGQWADAARLEVRPNPTPYAEALTWFARGLGAARSGDTTSPAASMAELARLRDLLSQRGDAYWSEQVEIQRRGVEAWRNFAAGRRNEALDGIREAADREAATEKAAVTPGPLAPARELQGEMLMAAGRPGEALSAFELTLQHEPNRRRALAGAQQAAQASGDSAKARDYAERVRRLTAGP